MLRVKRASAGSGKTYELAKTYIKLLITSKKPDYKRQLLKDGSFKESLSGIMAVTFTVKATAEMKARIVEKLADLAGADSVAPEKLKDIDYLEDFTKEFDTNHYEIARLARKALSTLLLNYSDFKVQTIDSFFQGILHTFAYEASLDDNFNMEINSDQMTAVGFDNTLDSISEEGPGGDAGAQTLYWLDKLMEKSMSGNKWNVFTRDIAQNSLYTDLIKKASNLEKEDYHKVRDELIGYFERLDRPFKEVVEELDDANLLRWQPYHEERRRAAENLIEVLKSHGMPTNSLPGGKDKYLLECVTDFNLLQPVYPREVNRRKATTGYSLSAKAAAEADAAATAAIDAAFDEWADASQRYFEAMEPHRTAVPTWLAYRAMIPSLMTVLEIARQRDSYLQSINTLQISDTTQILSRIIGKDDTPFVYERMGSRLNHFLIDEFQDTSRMQWRNLKPLLDESESRDNENLIIGDAKQSIYRFRNADYTLITGLEKEFHSTLGKEPDDSGKANTNYRSKPRIVEFNNHVFSNMPYLKATRQRENVFPEEVAQIYRDCVQAFPEKKKGAGKAQGYVEAVFYTQKPKSVEDGAEDAVGPAPGFAELPSRILELRQRGYRFRDIGVLVKKHEHGQAAIAAISEHNRQHPENAIPVISEEDLLVSGALSVKLIIHALEMVARGLGRKSIANPVLPEPIDENELYGMLRTLNTLSLPSMTEAIIGRFIPSERRNAEAPFIAAFQDAVIDYCTSRGSDVGTFLKWWRQKAGKLSITSPEDSDGIRLQTIHKSKGLQYKCVILPIADFPFTPNKHTEWKWVETAGNVLKSELLPPHLPVETNSFLRETAHAEDERQYKEAYALDNLNNMYVGLTRAEDELYIYLPLPAPERTGAGAMAKMLGLVDDPDVDSSLLTEPLVIEESEERKVVKYGVPVTPEQLVQERMEKESKEEEKRDKNKSVKTVDSYDIVRPLTEEEAERVKDETGEKLKQTVLFRNANPLKTIVHPDGREEELDPRAEGTIKHRIMQMVNVPSDLDKALRKMRMEGLVAPEQVDSWGNELRAAMESVASRGWFAPGMRVFNERPLVKEGKRTHRPDRFVVSPEGDAVIIDYKFGEEGSYRKQVKDYAELLRESGSFRSLRAYLWYVTTGEIEQVV